MTVRSQSLMKTVCEFPPFSPRCSPLLCMSNSIYEMFLEAHLLMVEKILDWNNQMLICEQIIPNTNILALRLDAAFILHPEHGLDPPAKFYRPTQLAVVPTTIVLPNMWSREKSMHTRWMRKFLQNCQLLLREPSKEQLERTRQEAKQRGLQVVSLLVYCEIS